MMGFDDWLSLISIAVVVAVLVDCYYYCSCCFSLALRFDYLCLLIICYALHHYFIIYFATFLFLVAAAVILLSFWAYCY